MGKLLRNIRVLQPSPADGPMDQAQTAHVLLEAVEVSSDKDPKPPQAGHLAKSSLRCWAKP